MPAYRVLESVGANNEPVNQWSDIEHHHPSQQLHEEGRVYAKINGKAEEIGGDYNGTAAYTPGGQLMVSKDIILQSTSNNSFSVPVPSPANGYIGQVNPNNGTVTILDRPGGEVMFQLRHMKIDENIKPGTKVEYGQSLGTQSGYGNGDPNYYGPHLHIDANVKYLDQADRYVRDIAGGRITTDQHPTNTTNLVNAVPKIEQISGNFPAPPRQALADGKIEFGEKGPDVALLQEKLRAAGAKDAQGREIRQDGDFGNGTRQALENYQRSQQLPVTGSADQQTLIKLGVIGGQQQTQAQQAPTQQTPPQPGQRTPTPSGTGISGGPNDFGPNNPLGTLISSGEGGYGSYNRGRAGDANGAQIDFSQMTVGEVMRRQDLPRNDPERLFAVGKYQMIPGTFEEAVNTLGIDRNAKLTPQLQERMFADYLIDEKRPQVKAYITGETSGAQGLQSAQLALAREFASVADPRTGRSVYDGDSAGNSASITAAEVGTTLNQMRGQYQQNIGSGMSAAEAYRALSGDPKTQGQTQADARPVQAQSGGINDTLLIKGERGDGVKRLQEALNKAGIVDADGKPLPTTGYYGELTEAAVRKYQEQHKLGVDGKAGKDTLTALGIYPGQQQTPAASAPGTVAATADKPQPPAPGGTDKPQVAAANGADKPPATADKPQPTPPGDRSLISSPDYPDKKLHEMYQQAVSNLEQLGPSGGFKTRQQLENAAAAVAVDAKATGLHDINHISRTTGANGQVFLVAVQGDPTSAASKNSYIDYNQAVNQTVQQSSRMAEAMKPAVQQVQQAPQVDPIVLQAQAQPEPNRMAVGVR